MIWFAFLLAVAATLAIHLINFAYRRSGVWSNVLLGLGVVAVIWMTVQFVNSQIELARLRDQVEWRDINTKQRERMVSQLSTFSGQQYTFAAPLNREAGNFSTTFDHMLEDAGWVKFRGPYPDLSRQRPQKGVEIEYAASRSPDLKPVAEAVAAVLRDENIAAYATENSALNGAPGLVVFQIDVKVR